MIVSALFLSLFLTHPAQATELGLDLYQGSSSKSQAVSASGDFAKGFDWDLNYTRTVSDTTSAANASLQDTSHEFILGLGLETPELFSAGIGVHYTSTPEENVQSVGPEFSLGYTLKAEKTKDDAFRPRANLELTAATQNFAQNFAGTKTRRNGNTRPVSGENTIEQKALGLKLKFKPWSWFALKASYTAYSYNKDVNQFLQFLDSTKALVATTGLSSAVTGFYKNTLLAGVTFYFLEDCNIALSRAVSTIALDDSIATTDKIMLEYEMNESWNLGIGTEKLQSSSSAITDQIGILSAGYEF
jgi:hypothetical protein